MWLIIFFSFFIVMGLFFQPWDEFIAGFVRITLDPSILVSDYIAIGGIGATFVNAGLLPLISLYFIYKMDLQPNGSIVMALLLIFGFGFFGKNIFNVWPLVLGVYLYSRRQGVPYKNYITMSLLSTCLSPAVNQISLLVPNGDFHINLILSIAGGVFLGFILPPVISHCTRVHEGFILSNTGFAAGFIAIMFVAIFKTFGFEMASRNVWSTEYTMELLFILVTIFTITIFFGLVLNCDHSGEGIFWDLSRESGRAVTDYFLLYGFAVPLINIGVVGMIYTILTYLMTGTLNGPFMAGIMATAGFAAFGLNIRNALPVTLGAIIAAHLNSGLHDPNYLMMVILFGTSLAPFGGYFGPLWGIVAGFLHLTLTLNVGVINAGINLYNTGFVAGLVVIVLLPIASALKDYN